MLADGTGLRDSPRVVEELYLDDLPDAQRLAQRRGIVKKLNRRVLGAIFALLCGISALRIAAQTQQQALVIEGGHTD